MEASRKGLLSLNGFLALWAVTTAADPRRTLAHAYYLGCGRAASCRSPLAACCSRAAQALLLAGLAMLLS